MSSFADRKKFFELKSNIQTALGPNKRPFVIKRSTTFRDAQSGIAGSLLAQAPPSSSEAPPPIIRLASIKDASHNLILLLGQSGAGKSSMLNAMFGGETIVAAESSNMSSGTSSIEVYEGYWLGDTRNEMVTVVDTPGFFDTERRDTDFLSKLMTFLRDFPPSLLRIVAIPLPITESRSTSAYTRMLDQIELLFGTEIWEHCIFFTTLHNQFNPHRDYSDLRKQKEEEWRKWLSIECNLPNSPILPFSYNIPKSLEAIKSKTQRTFTPKSSQKIQLFLQSNPSAGPQDVLNEVKELNQMKVHWEQDMERQIKKAEETTRKLERRKKLCEKHQEELQEAEKRAQQLRAQIAAGPPVRYV